MGSAPSILSTPQVDELRAKREDLIERAASAIADADVLLVATGAGWSADSGLAVYKDVADVAAYRDKKLTYHDLCNPQVLKDDPALFYGFWGGCMNDYRTTEPHAGYSIIASWRNALFQRNGHLAEQLAELMRDENVDARRQPMAGPFFSLTSNVDAHWHKGGHYSRVEVYECHGNTEQWQCTDRMCSALLAQETPKTHPTLTDGSWQAPPGFAFAVEPDTRLAPEGPPAKACCRTPCTSQPFDAGAFAGNWPKCVVCGEKPARPAVLMFSDQTWAPNDQAKKRWEQWKWAVLNLCSPAAKAADSAAGESTGGSAVEGGASAAGEAAEAGGEATAIAPPLKVVILEIGCGANVTTIRQKTEAFAEQVQNRGSRATLIRVNPEHALADSEAVRPFTLPLLSKGLDAVKAIDAVLQTKLEERRAGGKATGGGKASTAVALAPRQKTSERGGADPMAGLRFEHIKMTRDDEEEPSEEAVTKEPAGTAVEGAPATAPAPSSSPLSRSKVLAAQKILRQVEQKSAEAQKRSDKTQASLDETLKGLRETQAKLARFDELGRQLMAGMAKVMANVEVKEAVAKRGDGAAMDSISEE